MPASRSRQEFANAWDDLRAVTLDIRQVRTVLVLLVVLLPDTAWSVMRHGRPADVLGWSMLQHAVDHAGPAAARSASLMPSCSGAGSAAALAVDAMAIRHQRSSTPASGLGRHLRSFREHGEAGADGGGARRPG